MNSRIKEVRSNLSMTQNEFGLRLGVARNTVANYETGNRTPSNQIIISICREFNVNEDWLRTGEGEMFNEIPTDELDKLAERYNLNPLAKKVVESFVTLEKDEMDVVLKLVSKIISTNDEIVVTEDNNDLKYEDEFKYELESYRMELEAEKKGLTSSVLEDTEGPKAK